MVTPFLVIHLDGGGVYFNDYFNWRSVPQFSKLVNESPAAHIASQLMGSRMRRVKYILVYGLYIYIYIFKILYNYYEFTSGTNL